MKRALMLCLLSVIFPAHLWAKGNPAKGKILCDTQATWTEQLAAQEVRRYIYVRTGTLLKIEKATSGNQYSQTILVGIKSSPIITRFAADRQPLRQQLSELQPEQYVLQTFEDGESKTVIVAGGDGIGTLYAAYRFAEHLGVRFYLHGDVVPDRQVSFDLPDLKELGKPLFKRRGIQPFHDFPEGPDWWDANDYKAILAQLPKMRMNFFGLHTYPEGGVGPEPAVWIGPPGEIGTDGKVTASYPSRHFVTGNVTSAWGYRPQDTSSYAYGAGVMFARDDYGAQYMQETHPWPEMDPQQSCGLFDRFGLVLRDSFTFARLLGIKTCIGTETPLVIPKSVRERLQADGKSPDAAETIELVYEGMFRRIAATYPIDYYWLWTPENWTWSEVKQEQVDATLRDFKAAQRAAQKAKVSFQLATCGWVLGPTQSPALFDEVLPKSWPLSCINRNVGHDPVESGFARIAGRPQWAIPWLEDDPALILPQLWVGRMRKDAADALRYGCDGLLGIHWRTRILGPNVAALAQAAWSQEGWKTAAVDQDPPQLEGAFNDRHRNYPDWRKAACSDFYLDWAMSQFGTRAGRRIAPLFAKLDCDLPRPSTWVHGPGGIVPDRRPWSAVRHQYDFVNELRDLRPAVSGAGNQERFDYWLNQFRYLRALGKLNCTWAELNAALESMKQTKQLSARKRLAQRKTIPLRIRLVRELTYVQQYLLQTISTKGGMGTVTNWQQHVFPMLLDASEKAIVDATGKPLSVIAQLPRDYPGEPRIFVPSVRTSLTTGESLKLEVVIVGMRPAVTRIFWRPMGVGRFESKPLRHVGRGVYRAELDAHQLESDIEYYVEVTAKGKQMRFPPTAPALNQTVVLIANTE